ncbi:MAG: GNAT family N-acetyltransferase [Lachnospiraceae bacterium]|nr:GNAT family N-acetyltransferase [Lachnospiraceae bacterium]
MFGVLIGEENEDMFLGIIPADIKESVDVAIGAVDEETDTACGVLSAEALENGELMINFIYVEEEWRNKGAAKAMIRLLQEIAAGTDRTGITCGHWIPKDDGDPLNMVLNACGFYDDDHSDDDKFDFEAEAEREKYMKKIFIVQSWSTPAGF